MFNAPLRFGDISSKIGVKMSHGSSLNIPGWCQSSLLGDNSDGV